MPSRERETLLLLAGDKIPSEIAGALQVSKHYVYELIRLLKARLGARTTAGIIVQAIREGLIEVPVKPRKKEEADADFAD
jgi:DNA-binding CsgD family transcriptional regulator